MVLEWAAYWAWAGDCCERLGPAASEIGGVGATTGAGYGRGHVVFVVGIGECFRLVVLDGGGEPGFAHGGGEVGLWV